MLNLLQRRPLKNRHPDTDDSPRGEAPAGNGRFSAAVSAALRYAVMNPPILSARWGVQNSLVNYARRKKAHAPDDKK